MEFLGRVDDIAELRRLRELSAKSSRFVVVTGRRRIGKTELVRQAFGDRPYVYFLVTRSVEKELCETCQAEYERFRGGALPSRIEKFSELFRWIMEESAKSPVTLVIDEFQDLDRIAPSVFSELAGEWDRLHKTARINLVACGSVNRMMNRIFFDKGEPLYGRNTGHLRIEPFSLSELKSLMKAGNPGFTGDDLLALWVFTGGVARYVEQLVDDGAFTRETMIESVFRRGSSALDEGRYILAQEFGKDCGTYFAILSAIANGRTSYGDIANAVGIDPGAYLSNLENEYALVNKVIPAYASPKVKSSRYKIEDRFFRYWFRFAWKYQYLVELGKIDELRAIVRRDFDAFSGEGLESYFRKLFRETKPYTRMGGWWDRKGENEIDLVCEDEANGVLDFYEVKREAGRINRSALERKVEAFFEKNPAKRELTHNLYGVSLADM